MKKISYLEIIKTDKSSWLLIFTNLVTICLAMYSSWGIKETLFCFYFQSLIVGFFCAVRILRFSIASRQDRVFAAAMVICRFAIFHLIYLFFLGIPTVMILKSIFVACLIFFCNHLFSYLYNVSANMVDKSRLQDISDDSILRVIPIHAFIIVGPLIIPIVSMLEHFRIVQWIDTESLSAAVALILFLILKGCFDVWSHVTQHANQYIKETLGPDLMKEINSIE